MSDLIDRQDLINALETDCSWEIFDDWGNRTPTGQTIIETIKKLPSAEKVQLSGEDATFDCISRQAAIDVEGLDEQIRCEMCRNPMHTNRGCDGNCKYDEKLYERIMQMLGERIKPLPSAQPRKKGEWICQADDDIWNCSECNFEIDGTGCIDPLKYLKTYNFCPNCGADMRGEQNDTD